MSSALAHTFQNEVLLTRAAFSDDLKSLPEPFGQVIENYLASRRENGKANVLLGEYAPWLLADFVGYSGDDRLREFVRAWMHVYVYTLVVDDVVDQGWSDRKPVELIAGSLLLERGLRRLYELDKGFTGHSYLRNFQSDLDSLALATSRELESRAEHKVSAQWTNCVVDVDKARIMNLCLEFFSANRSGSHKLDASWESVKPLFSAMQLLDDITDVEADWRSGHWTQPIVQCIGRLQPHVNLIPI